MALPQAYAAVLGDYAAKLARAPVSAQTRRTYASKVRQFLVWLQVADTDGDPLREPALGTGRCATTAPTCKPSPNGSRPR